MADRFKEYKAYVPPKWASFDDLPAGSIKKKLSFTNCMASVAGTQKVDSSGDPVRRHGKQLRGSEKWTAEMQQYCKEQREKEQAEAKTAALEADLKKKQARASRMRERALEAPTLGGGKMPSSYMSFIHTNPAEVSRYHHLLSTAAVVDQASRTQECEAKRQELHDKLVAEVNKDLEHIEAQRLVREKDKAHVSKMVRYKREHSAAEAAHNRSRAESEAQEERQKEHELALKRQEDLAARKQEQDLRQQQAREQRNAKSAARVQVALQHADDKRSKTECLLKKKTESAAEHLLMMETDRRNKVSLNLGELARQRAEENQAKRRNAQLAMCEADAAKREARLEEKRKNDALDLKHKKARHMHHDAEIEQNLSARWVDREKSIEDQIEHHHKGPPQKSGPDEDRTLKRLQHAADLLRARQRDDEAALEAELRCQQERESRVSAGYSMRRQEQHENFIRSEQKRTQNRVRAKELEASFQEETEHDVQERLQHADDVLARIERQRQKRVAHESGEKARKIKEALELVNVKKTVNLMKKLRKRDKAAARRAAERHEEQLRHAALEHEQEEERQNRMRSQIEQAQQDRESRNLKSLHDHENKCAAAQASRDDSNHRKSDELHDDFERRLQKARSALTAKENRFLRLKEETAAKDKILAQRLQDERKDQDRQRRRQAMELERRIADAQYARDEQRNEWLDRTTKRLEKTYRQGALSPAHPLNDSFGSYKPPVIPPPRARTTSPY